VVAHNIRKFGLDEFRNPAHGIIISQTEAVTFDVRLHMGASRRARLARQLLETTPLRRITDAQANMALSIYRERQALFEECLGLSPRVAELLKNYTLANRGGFGEINTCTLFDQTFASEAILLLDVHDHIEQVVSLAGVTSFAEIGGGYGAYADIVLQNLVSVRKVLLIDVAPNLYITYQFLKDLYGDAVRDYRTLSNASRIEFHDDDDLEILVLAPHLAERFVGSIDYFHNKDSFVEMPIPIARNYSRMASTWLRPSSVVALTSYREYDLMTTFDPNILVEMFSGEFIRFDRSSLLPGHVNAYNVARIVEPFG
jgi:putative sugar O-methyltransferase